MYGAYRQGAAFGHRVARRHHEHLFPAVVELVVSHDPLVGRGQADPGTSLYPVVAYVNRKS